MGRAQPWVVAWGVAGSMHSARYPTKRQAQRHARKILRAFREDRPTWGTRAHQPGTFWILLHEKQPVGYVALERV